MKKYIYFVIIFILLVLFKIQSNSYAIEDCVNHIININNLNSINLINYMKDNYPKTDINYFCSYNNCYYIKNEGIATALKNYLILLEKKGMTDYVLEAEVKGFPITEISLNQCK